MKRERVHQREKLFGSRNNVTQLKIQCARCKHIMYQIQIHTRIPLSKHHIDEKDNETKR